MSFADWHSGVPVAATDNQYGFLNMSTVDDLSYTLSEEEKSRLAAQIAVTGRRGWKTLRGKGEAVWPPNLEAALIEALEKYQPEGPRPNKLLGRFPMRNRFISDYIFDATGKRRTPKQVGSRLQQMKDTCKGGPILDLISPRISSAELEYMTKSPGTASEGSRHASRTLQENPPSMDRPTIYVNISVRPTTSSVPIIHFIPNDIANPLLICLAPSAVPILRGQSVSRNSRGSLLCTLSNTVQFASPCALTPLSTFNIYFDGSHTPIHTEEVPLEYLSSPVQSPGWLYSTELTPAFWRTLCEEKDPMRYTIMQRLTTIQSYRSPNIPGCSSAPPVLAPSSQEISIVYRFDIVDDLNISDVVDDLNISDVVDDLNIFDVFDIKEPGFPSYFQSAVPQQNEFVASSQQHPMGLGYCQWDSGTEHTANWSYNQTQPAGYYYSPASRYTQNEYTYDHFDNTQSLADAPFKYGDPQYEAGYSEPEISPWISQHMPMSSPTSTHDQSQLLFPFL